MIPNLPGPVELDERGELPGSRETIEWDWVDMDDEYLHCPSVWNDEDYNAYDEEAETWCGQRGHGSIPGVFSRMGRPRCPTCCQTVGMPEGIGSPKNDDQARPVAQLRIDCLKGQRPTVMFP
jgi:hypothetical protein